jgi:poly(A) polymerase
VEEKDRVRNFQPPITGEDIMHAFNIAPSKVIGDIKTVIKDAILDGHIQNERAQAWGLMLEAGERLGLHAVVVRDPGPQGPGPHPVSTGNP